MLTRRTWIRTAASGLGAFGLGIFFGGPKHAHAATRDIGADVLKVALRVGRPEDKEFIDRVVAMMNRGELPRSIVQKSFFWARKKRKHKFQYFKRVLIILAAKVDIVVS